MFRPVRQEFPAAIFHLTSRGDRHAFLAVVAPVLDRIDAMVLAYRLMDTHDHFVMHTWLGDLSRQSLPRPRIEMRNSCIRNAEAASA